MTAETYRGVPGLVCAGRDTFGEFCRLRQRAYRERTPAGVRSSPDPVIDKHHFTNVVRAQDPGSVLAARLLEPYRPQPRLTADQLAARRRHALWTTLAYRLTNRREVWENFRAKVMGVYPDLEIEEAWLDHLHRLKADGRRVFTGRHYTMGLTNYVRTLTDVRGLTDEHVARMFVDAPSFTTLVREVPGVGPFFGWQATADLLASGHLPPAPDHVVLGPGAVLALRWIRDERPFRAMFNAAGKRVVGATMSHLDQEQARAMVVDLRSTQVSWLRLDGTVDAALFDAPLTVTDLEHALCEYGRWGVEHAKIELRARRVPAETAAS